MFRSASKDALYRAADSSLCIPNSGPGTPSHTLGGTSMANKGFLAESDSTCNSVSLSSLTVSAIKLEPGASTQAETCSEMDFYTNDLQLGALQHLEASTTTSDVSEALSKDSGTSHWFLSLVQFHSKKMKRVLKNPMGSTSVPGNGTGSHVISGTTARSQHSEGFYFWAICR